MAKSIISRLISIAVLIALFLSFNAMFLRYALIAIITVKGGSMFPNIVSGDMLVCVSSRLTGVSVNDVYVYYTPYGNYVVHRAVAINGSYVLFQGDNNLHVDGYIPVDRVACKVVYHIPRVIWIVTLSIGIGASLTYVASRRSSTERLLSVISVLLMIVVTSAGVTTLQENMVFAKPNPVPIVEVVLLGDNVVYGIVSNHRVVESVSCFDQVSEIPCRLNDSILEVYGKPVGNLTVYMKLKSQYNITVAVVTGIEA